MIGREEEKTNVVPLDGAVSETERLPYCIELWAASGDAVERILARAVSVELARAIFKAAGPEYPRRRITLRRGRRVVADTSR